MTDDSTTISISVSFEEKGDDNWLATFAAGDLHASGETQEESMDNLVDICRAKYVIYVLRHSRGKLSKHLRKTLPYLIAFMDAYGDRP